MKFRVKFEIDTIIEAKDKNEALERAIEDITDYLYWENITIDEIMSKTSIKEIERKSN